MCTFDHPTLPTFCFNGADCKNPHCWRLHQPAQALPAAPSPRPSNRNRKAGAGRQARDQRPQRTAAAVLERLPACVTGRALKGCCEHDFATSSTPPTFHTSQWKHVHQLFFRCRPQGMAKPNAAATLKHIAKKMNSMQHDYDTHFSLVVLFARQIAESAAKVLSPDDVVSEGNLSVLINALKGGDTPPWVIDSLHQLRCGGNDVVHPEVGMRLDHELKRTLVETTLFVATHLGLKFLPRHEVFGPQGNGLKSWYQRQKNTRSSRRQRAQPSPAVAPSAPSLALSPPDQHQHARQGLGRDSSPPRQAPPSYASLFPMHAAPAPAAPHGALAGLTQGLGRSLDDSTLALEKMGKQFEGLMGLLCDLQRTEDELF